MWYDIKNIGDQLTNQEWNDHVTDQLARFNKFPAGYLIWKDGTYTYAHNGITGKIDYFNTDDASTVNSAISALRNGGCILFKGQTTYNMSKRLIIPTGINNIRLTGEDWSSIIKLNNGVNDRLLVNDWTNGNTNITIDNLCFDGNNQNQTAIGPMDSQGNAGMIHLTKVDGLLINNCQLLNALEDGIQIDTVNNFIISNNVIKNWLDDAIAPNLASTFGSIVGNICDTSVILPAITSGVGAPEGIEVQDGSHDISITGNIVKNVAAAYTGGDGIVVNSHTGQAPCYNVNITGNISSYNGRSGLAITGQNNVICHDINVTGNTFSTNGGNNIVIQGASGNLLDGIKIADNISTYSTYYGIAIQYATKCSITGNQCSYNQHGIKIWNPNTYHLISGNYLNDNTYTGINLDVNTANCYVFGNVAINNNSGNISNAGTTNIISNNFP